MTSTRRGPTSASVCGDGSGALRLGDWETRAMKTHTHTLCMAGLIWEEIGSNNKSNYIGGNRRIMRPFCLAKASQNKPPENNL